jgi:hypothetical protein
MNNRNRPQTPPGVPAPPVLQPKRAVIAPPPVRFPHSPAIAAPPAVQARRVSPQGPPRTATPPPPVFSPHAANTSRQVPVAQAKVIAPPPVRFPQRQVPPGPVQPARTPAPPHRTVQRAAAPGPAVIQRLVIRIRDFKEMWIPFTKDTIWDSSKTMKNYPALTAHAAWQEDVGITQALTGRALQATEPLVVVSHGGQPTRNNDGTISGNFGGRTPETLAQEISGILPANYSAEIFLNGCYTGMRVGFATAGSSYIERFGVALLQHVAQYTGIVKGNIGPASTFSQNEELIGIDRATYDRWRDNNPHGVVSNQAGTKFYMRGPFGQARYRPSDDHYNDFGYAQMLAM